MIKKSFLLLTLLFVLAPAQAAFWFEIADGYLIDTNSIKHENSYTTAWFKAFANRKEYIEKQRIAYTLYYDNFNCNNKTFRTLERHDYNKKGQILSSQKFPFGEEYMPVPPETKLNVAFNAVCKVFNGTQMFIPMNKLYED